MRAKQVPVENKYKLGVMLTLKNTRTKLQYLETIQVKIPLSQWALGCIGHNGKYYFIHTYYKVINQNDRIELILADKFDESYTSWKKELLAKG